ncbi:hypothetical protein [Actinomadura formosensis]|uniref:hypothetical protein n=1 Tax=Actinomadura formosensis TaxID=60706 RepID=UPI003D8CA90E
MSGPRDSRETAGSAGTSGVPADPAPPSFGGTAPPADAPPPADASPPAAETAGEPPGETETAEPAPLRLPAFGLQTPWWAAESTDTAPPAGEPAAEPVPAGAEPSAEAAEPLASGTGQLPGTLVAGAGIPAVDSRGAVPAEPFVKPPISGADTDPDGFQPVPPAGDTPAVTTAEDETAVDNPLVNEAAEDRSASPHAFEKAKEAENASASPAVVLVPDAILPPGFVPPTGSGPFPNTGPAGGGTATAEQPVITPVHHAEGGTPPAGSPPGRPPKGTPGGAGGGSRRRPLLIGGGAAVVLATAIALFTVGGTGSSGDGQHRGAAEPSAAPSTSAPATPVPSPKPVNIGDEKTDPQDLTFRDVFPEETIQLGGRTYARDRWSLNRDVSYAARGSMLKVLKRESCRKIIRATFIDQKNELAVTSGIAVMPTKAAAMTVSKAGDPAAYEWFRGMAGKRSPDIDRAGGYAAVTVRGRYVAYAYVQRADGKKAKPGDPLIKQAAQRFLDYELRPIIARTRG